MQDTCVVLPHDLAHLHGQLASHEHRSLRELGLHLTDPLIGLHPTATRHPHVEEQELKVLAAGGFNRLGCIFNKGRVSTNALERSPEKAPNGLLIFCNENPNSPEIGLSAGHLGRFERRLRADLHGR